MARLGLKTVNTPDYASSQPMPYANPEERPVQKIEKFATFLNELPWFRAETDEEKAERERNEEIEQAASTDLANWANTSPVDEDGKPRDAAEVLGERNAKVGLVAGGYNPLLAERQGIAERLDMALAIEEAMKKRGEDAELGEIIRKLNAQSKAEEDMRDYAPRDTGHFEPGYDEQLAYQRRMQEKRED